MKKSLKRQMIMIFAGLAAIILVVLMLLNVSFLGSYYGLKKEADFERLYHRIKKIEHVLFTKDAKETSILKIAESTNISFLVWDVENGLLFSNVAENNAIILQDQLSGYMMGQTQKSGDVIRDREEYQIFQGQDPRNSTDYLEMWGMLDNGYYFIIRSPLESMKESAMISNQFLVFVGTGMILVCSIAVWLISEQLTKPIKELTFLSDKMANLDFEAKYSGDAINEIGELGENFNRMSDKLQTTILELKKANNDLQKDIHRKEKEEQRRNEFIGSISHELKTPLALILGYAEGLKEGVYADRSNQEYYCEVIIDEAGKMNQMVKNLLTLNELEFGDDNTSFSRFDIVELTKNILTSMDILFKQDDISLCFQQKEELYVWSDELKIEQVLRNYISNAIHHVSNEKVIEIKMIAKNDKVKVSVFNTGNPIPDEDITHIWEMFYKADKARTRAYGGNGIGLSIVKATMDSLHQNYGVKNYVNGVEFWLEINQK